MRRPLILALCLAASLAVAVPAALGDGETFNPPSYNFGNQKLGTQSAPKTFVLTASPVSNYSPDPYVSGDFDDFLIDNQTCFGDILQGQSCTLTVTFAPTKAGHRGGTLRGSSGSATPQAALSGNGTQTAKRKRKCKRHHAGRRASAAKKCKRKHH